MYSKSDTKDGQAVNLLVAITTVEGVTASEMTEVFFKQELKLKWDASIEKSTELEKLADNSFIFHQVFERCFDNIVIIL